MSSTTMTAAGMDVGRRAHRERRPQVRETRRTVQPVLLRRRAHALEAIDDGQPDRGTERSRDELGLVVAALPQPLPMHRDRNQRHGARDLQEDVKRRSRGLRERPGQAARALVLQARERPPDRSLEGEGGQREGEILPDRDRRVGGDESRRGIRRRTGSAEARRTQQRPDRTAGRRTRAAAADRGSPAWLPCWRWATYRRRTARLSRHRDRRATERPLGAGRGGCYRTGTRCSPAEASVREDEPEGPQHRAERPAPRSDRAQAAPARPHHPRDRPRPTSSSSATPRTPPTAPRWPRSRSATTARWSAPPPPAPRRSPRSTSSSTSSSARSCARRSDRGASAKRHSDEVESVLTREALGHGRGR